MPALQPCRYRKCFVGRREENAIAVILRLCRHCDCGSALLVWLTAATDRAGLPARPRPLASKPRTFSVMRTP